MKKGDEIIWDSNFGYDIGIFRDDAPSYNNCIMEFRSGARVGELGSVSKSQIHPYSKELVEKSTLRYGYEKSFSETF